MSLINIRRLYSTGLTDWTKTSLRRLKKSELLKIAKENQLKVTGTKNDIIDELLGYQDARQTSPPLQRQLNDETTAKHIPEETPLENDMSEDWVKAFDMKVAQRGSSFKRPFDPKRPAPIFRPDVEKKKRVEPVISIGEIREVVVSEPAPVQEVEEIDGMDGLWVEAFDRKVGTRGARHQLADTLSPEPKLSGLALEFVSFESPDAPPKAEVIKEEEKKCQPKVKEEEEQKVYSSTKKEEKKDERTHHIETVIKSEPFTAKQDSGHQQQNQSNVVSGLVGTSMLVWYFGGGETFQKIWDFFGSS